VAHVAAYRHWRRLSTHTFCELTAGLDPERPGEVLQRPLPEPVVGPVRAEHVRELDERVARPFQRLTWTTVSSSSEYDENVIHESAWPSAS
jgi:hypothetical protein